MEPEKETEHYLQPCPQPAQCPQSAFIYESNNTCGSNKVQCLGKNLGRGTAVFEAFLVADNVSSCNSMIEAIKNDQQV